MVLLNTLTGLPPVLVGLFVYLALSRTGPLGTLEMLFTVPAIVVAQVFLSLPLVATIVAGTVMAIDPELPEQLGSLGANRWQIVRATLREGRSGLLIALATGFGAVISEVGAVMMVGGNIEGQTRVLTTAILLETRRGEFAMALALGGVLLTLTLLVNIGIMGAQRRRRAS
jgi:tungstate transport system permease protein